MALLTHAWLLPANVQGQHEHRHHEASYQTAVHGSTQRVSPLRLGEKCRVRSCLGAPATAQAQLLTSATSTSRMQPIHEHKARLCAERKPFPVYDVTSVHSDGHCTHGTRAGARSAMASQRLCPTRTTRASPGAARTRRRLQQACGTRARLSMGNCTCGGKGRVADLAWATRRCDHLPALRTR